MKSQTEKQYKHWSLEQCNKIIKEYKDETQWRRIYFNRRIKGAKQ